MARVLTVESSQKPGRILNLKDDACSTLPRPHQACFWPQIVQMPWGILVFGTQANQSSMFCEKLKNPWYSPIAIRWEPQEEGMMSKAASFPSVRNQGLIEPVGEESRFWMCCWLTWQRRQKKVWWRQQQRRTCTQHNQDTLPQRFSEGVNLTGLLKTKD